MIEHRDGDVHIFLEPHSVFYPSTIQNAMSAFTAPPTDTSAAATLAFMRHRSHCPDITYRTFRCLTSWVPARKPGIVYAQGPSLPGIATILNSGSLLTVRRQIRTPPTHDHRGDIHTLAR